MSRWHRLVLERAAAARVDLPAHAVDELAAHLEDLYAAGRAAGLTDTDAVRRAVAALDDGPMADEPTSPAWTPTFPTIRRLDAIWYQVERLLCGGIFLVMSLMVFASVVTTSFGETRR